MRAKTKDILISTSIGLLGALVGIVGTSYMNIYSELKLKRNQLTIDAFTYSSSDNIPKEMHDLNMFLNAVKTYSALDASSIKDLAELARKYPNCTNTLSKECEILTIKMINIMRKELNAGLVSEDDLKIILDPHYNKAIQAFKLLNIK
jgi:hypothetical protein